MLGELNARFSMDDHDGHYFTMWYGIYQSSTRLLRYANAGQPPPLILTTDGEGHRLPTVDGCFPARRNVSRRPFPRRQRDGPPGRPHGALRDGVFDDMGKPDKFIAVCRQTIGEPSVWLDSVLGHLARRRR